jgi:hypothetical protein
MRFKLNSMTALAAALAMIGSAASISWAQTAVKVNPSTGIAEFTATSALSCPQVACEGGDTCSFVLIAGSGSSFTRFGPLLTKATFLGCVAINTTNAVSVGSAASGVDTTCAPATGSLVLTASSKAAPSVSLAFAAQVCTLPTDLNKQVLFGAYILTGTTDKKIASAAGSIAAGYDVSTHAGELAFQGSRD